MTCRMQFKKTMGLAGARELSWENAGIRWDNIEMLPRLRFESVQQREPLNNKFFLKFMTKACRDCFDLERQIKNKGKKRFENCAT